VLNTKREEYIRANTELELKKLELNYYLANSISILKDKKNEATTDKNNKKILYDNAKEEYDNIILDLHDKIKKLKTKIKELEK
jgi:flagellar hook-associated protein FlgK